MCFLRENKKGNQPFLFLMSSNSLMIPNIINPPPDNTSTILNIFFIYYHLLFIIWRVIYANIKKKRISNAKKRGPVDLTELLFISQRLNMLITRNPKLINKFIGKSITFVIPANTLMSK